MPVKAKLYYWCVLALGTLCLAYGLSRFTAQEWPKFLVYLAFALVSATWKLRVPGVPVTVSPVFAFILVGIAGFSLGQTLVIGCGATLLQCLYGTAVKPTAHQTAFSLAAVASATIAAYEVPHAWIARSAYVLPSLLPVAAVVFLLADGGLVCGMVALVSEQPWRAVGKKLTGDLLAYYLDGGLIAAVMIGADLLGGWLWGLLVMPLVYLICDCHRARLQRRVS